MHIEPCSFIQLLTWAGMHVAAAAAAATAVTAAAAAAATAVTLAFAYVEKFRYGVQLQRY
eukprot:11696444-Alexandrium_andersonii.AAC.1